MFILVLIFILGSLNAQDSETKLYPKHEIGFSVGVFPTIGFLDFDGEFVLPFTGDPMFKHTDYLERDNGMYEKMYHFGSYTFNYNYHFNSKHSIGGSFSWVGKHIDKYWIFSSSSLNPDADTINGSGWNHYLTLQGNYRKTYYHQKKISLYYGIHWGITICVRDKDILPKETRYMFLGKESNSKYKFSPAMHLNVFGLETGEKYVFNLELGLGTQGVVKVGFKYKF